MKVVVTGLSGNVGTALLRRWSLADPGYDVVGVCRRPPSGRVEPYGRARWVALDVAAPDAVPRLTDAMRGAGCVVHLAWHIQPSRARVRMRSVNLGGTAAVLDAVDAAAVPHVVHLSSAAAYRPGPGDDPVDESWPTGGVLVSPYSRDKAGAEALLDRFAAQSSAVVARVRPPLIGQRAAGSQQARFVVGRPPPPLPRPLLPLPTGLRLQAVSADDVAGGVALLVQARTPGPFNLAGTGLVRRPELADLFGARLAVDVPPVLARIGLAAAYRLHLQQLDPSWLDLALAAPVVDSGRAHRELGWAATQDAQGVLRDVLAGAAAGAGHPSAPLQPGR